MSIYSRSQFLLQLLHLILCLWNVLFDNYDWHLIGKGILFSNLFSLLCHHQWLLKGVFDGLLGIRVLDYLTIVFIVQLLNNLRNNWLGWISQLRNFWFAIVHVGAIWIQAQFSFSCISRSFDILIYFFLMFPIGMCLHTMIRAFIPDNTLTFISLTLLTE